MDSNQWLPASAYPDTRSGLAQGSDPPLPGPRLEPPAGKRSAARRKAGGVLAAILAFLAKIKSILLLLPKIKLLTTAGTMAVSLAAYSFVFGWAFAAGFVLLLLVHEMGHVIALRREGIKASAPMFVPFLGAVISARSLGDNALAEAKVGLAGPVLGSIGAAVCVAIWHATGNDLWRALAFTGFFLNLFNLLPVVPLDGGRAMAAMAPWMWFVGIALMVALVFLMPSPLLPIFAIIGAVSSYNRWKALKAGNAAQQAYYRVRPVDRLLIAAVYLSLIALLVVGMQATNLHATFS